ncbi:hypothetical protein IPN35_03590 [Candidatus Peregrinibacteria bacterium]|nr:MAG: hypothetical protein IPN35_03590 [Candidatus Peregrinibacteria bacterium]
MRWILSFSLLFITPTVFAESGIFSPTLAKQECRKIRDREERSACYQRIEVLFQKEKQNKVFEEIKNEKGNLKKEECKSLTNVRLQTACFSEIARKQKEEEQKKQEEEKKLKSEPKEEEELFLRIIPCENILDFRERMICYSTFHRDQKKKTEEEKQKDTQEKEKNKETVLQNSPTLRQLECKKIRNREERSECYKDLEWKEKEKKIDEWIEQERNFDPIAEEKACLALRSDSAREKCLHRLNQKEQQIQRKQEEERKI